MKKIVVKLDHYLGKLESFFLVTILIILISASTLEIVLREIFQTSIIWLAPFLRSLILWIALIGGSKAVQQNASIKIDIFSHILPFHIQRLIEKSLSLVAMLISSYLVWISSNYVIAEKEFGDNFFLKIDVWHVETIFPIGFGFMTFHFFKKIFYQDEEV